MFAAHSEMWGLLFAGHMLRGRHHSSCHGYNRRETEQRPKSVRLQKPVCSAQTSSRKNKKLWALSMGTNIDTVSSTTGLSDLSLTLR